MVVTIGGTPTTTTSSGGYSYSLSEDAVVLSGAFSQSGGLGRYSLLVYFVDASNADASTPGNMNFSPVGRAFVDPPVGFLDRLAQGVVDSLPDGAVQWLADGGGQQLQQGIETTHDNYFGVLDIVTGGLSQSIRLGLGGTQSYNFGVYSNAAANVFSVDNFAFGNIFTGWGKLYGVNVVTGWGDHLSNGNTLRVRELLGFNDVVDTNSTAYAVGELIGSIHEALMIVASMGSLRNCFPAGTPVSTVDGLRPIETIKRDDKVWAYDLTASQWRPCRVMQTFTTRYRGRSVLVTVAGETIEATYRHPFFVTRGKHLDSRPRMEHLAEVPANATTPGRWVDAGDLRVGDELMLLGGRTRPVTRLQTARYEEAVYNFEVENLHCYAVGHTSVLVHNSNG